MVPVLLLPMNDSENPGFFAGRYWWVSAVAVIAVVFVVQSALTSAALELPYYWIPVFFAAAMAAPRQVGILALVALTLDMVSALRFGTLQLSGTFVHIAVHAVVSALAVVVAGWRHAYLEEKHRREQLLLDERKYLADVLANTNTGTWEWNVQTGETTFNEEWAGIIGRTLAELQPVSIETWMNYVHPEDLLRSNEELQKCFSRQSDIYECEARMRHRDGRWIWVLDRGRVVEWTPDGKPLRMMGTHRDITDRVLLREELARQARTDALTGLDNHRAFDESAAHEVARARELGTDLSVLVLELDDLKTINDAHGHHAGDRVLQTVARVLHKHLRESDHPARLGGGRYAVLLPDTPRASAGELADKFARDLAQTDVPVDAARSTKFGFACGVAALLPEPDGIEALLKRADQALHRDHEIRHRSPVG